MRCALRSLPTLTILGFYDAHTFVLYLSGSETIAITVLQHVPSVGEEIMRRDVLGRAKSKFN